MFSQWLAGILFVYPQDILSTHKSKRIACLSGSYQIKLSTAFYSMLEMRRKKKESVETGNIFVLFIITLL